jgi:hypothetical protein
MPSSTRATRASTRTVSKPKRSVHRSAVRDAGALSEADRASNRRSSQQLFPELKRTKRETVDESLSFTQRVKRGVSRGISNVKSAWNALRNSPRSVLTEGLRAADRRLRGQQAFSKTFVQGRCYTAQEVKLGLEELHGLLERVVKVNYLITSENPLREQDGNEFYALGKYLAVLHERIRHIYEVVLVEQQAQSDMTAIANQYKLTHGRASLCMDETTIMKPFRSLRVLVAASVEELAKTERGRAVGDIPHVLRRLRQLDHKEFPSEADPLLFSTPTEEVGSFRDEDDDFVEAKASSPNTSPVVIANSSEPDDNGSGFVDVD